MYSFPIILLFIPYMHYTYIFRYLIYFIIKFFVVLLHSALTSIVIINLNLNLCPPFLELLY